MNTTPEIPKGVTAMEIIKTNECEIIKNDNPDTVDIKYVGLDGITSLYAFDLEYINDTHFESKLYGYIYSIDEELNVYIRRRKNRKPEHLGKAYKIIYL